MSNVFDNDLLLRYVLGNLPAKDLISARSVCKKWSSIALKIMASRKCESMMLIHYPQKHWTKFEPKSHGKVLEKSQRYFQNMVNESQRDIMKIVCKEHAQITVQNTVDQCMQCMPKCVLLFSTSWEMTIGQNSVFPEQAQLVAIHAPAGVICSPKPNSLPIEVEKRFFRVDAVSFSLLGKHFCDFKITLTDWSERPSIRPDPNDPDHPLKAIILLSTGEEIKVFEEYLSTIPHKVALGGGVVDRISVRGLDEPSKLLSIAFSGKNIKAASLILNERIHQKNGMQKLINFKNTLGFDADRSDQCCQTIGYIFICAGRGRFYYHQKYNVESEILHKMFPKVTFTGLFGGGEYGHDCYGENDQTCDFKCCAEHYRAYTTVVMLIHFEKNSN